MIKANELRIGNWVNIPECGINAQIDIISTKKVCIDVTTHDLNKNQNDFELSSLNPIPLTPEILEKSGFEKMPLATYKRWVKYHPTFYLQLSKGFYYIISYKYYPNGINSLHQLQNLYFALTGEELIINL